MACTAQVIAHSLNPANVMIATVQLRYWRAIHGEVMTHRVFSRNASSSRAIPVRQMLKQVWSDPAGPIHWGANQAGMQARKELIGIRRKAAKTLWRLAGKLMCIVAFLMMKLGLHKQVANRLLEPWQYINVVVTSTEWDNFFALRDHPDAQPEIRELAEAVRCILSANQPKRLKAGDWHLPYASLKDLMLESLGGDEAVIPKLTLLDRIKISVARCARTSYLTFDRKPSKLSADKGLHDKLVLAEPPHMSPTEHQAQALEDDSWVKNFRGFRQYRSFLEVGEPV